MLTAQKILPVILVSITAIIALAFLLTHFAEQITAQAAFETGIFPNSPAKTKEVCVFKNPGVNCKNKENAKAFCNIGMEAPKNSVPTATHCTSGFITCELPCKVIGANCQPGKGKLVRRPC